MNGEYIKAMPLEKFHELALPYIREDIRDKELDTMKIAALLHTRTEVLAEIQGQLDFLYELPEYSTDIYTHKKMKTDAAVSLASLRKLLPLLESIGESDWSLTMLHDSVMALVVDMGVKNGQVLWPFRTALTGKQFTPGGAFEAAEILGREESIKRVTKGIELLEALA